MHKLHTKENQRTINLNLNSENSMISTQLKQLKRFISFIVYIIIATMLALNTGAIA